MFPSKAFHFGSFTPSFGPYQGGTQVYFTLLNSSSTSVNDFDSLFCEFQSVERTKLIRVNTTHASCLVPPSLFIQSVLLRVITTDIDTLVTTNLPNKHFTYMTDFEVLKLEQEYFIIGSIYATDMIIMGRNFNKSHQYQVLIQSLEVERDSWEIETKQNNEWNLTVDLRKVNTTINQKCRLEVRIVGNPQLTKHY